jgi:uncharacterized protein (DUF1778 family)
MKRSSQTKVRVVMSLHLPRPQHARLVKAAKASGTSLSEFVRTAADAQADQVLGVPVAEPTAAAVAA